MCEMKARLLRFSTKVFTALGAWALILGLFLGVLWGVTHYPAVAVGSVCAVALVVWLVETWESKAMTAEVYALRHVASGTLMPEMRSGRGYSHWSPSEPDAPDAQDGMPAAALPTPRFLATRRSAINARGQWARGVVTVSKVNDRDGDYWEDFDVVDVGRKVSDLEVVTFTLVEKKDGS